MTVLGITGGVGAGKSEVLAYLSEKYGACIVRLDDVSRELLSEGGACVKDAVRLFGDEIVLPDGTTTYINRHGEDLLFPDLSAAPPDVSPSEEAAP